MYKSTKKFLMLLLLLIQFGYISLYPQIITKFAVIGDFGKHGNHESDVADLVHSWNPDFILTAGDNNYDNGAESTIDENIGFYYHDYIFPYVGSYGSGAPDSNLFFPCPGNHDWRASNLTPYLNYFVLNTNGKSNNERYYSVVKGDIEFFMLDSDPNEPDGNTYNSTQGQWFQNAATNSTAKWKIAVFHHPPFSSDANHGNSNWMQWDFYGNEVPFVISGHAHDYERINLNNTVYFVNGLGGASLYNFGNPVPGSQVRYNGDYGAMLITESSVLTFEFYNVSGTLIDQYIADEIFPVELTSFSYNLIDSQVELNWTTATEINNYGFSIERLSTSLGTNWETIAFVQGNGNSNSPKDYYFVDKNVTNGKYSYRLKQIDNDGQFEYSNVLKVDISAPQEFVLYQNYPNPFNPSTNIQYKISNRQFVILKVYNILGNEVATLVNMEKPAGTYEFIFNRTDLVSGVYFYQLQAGDFVMTRKMVLLQ
jgi:hypothetical protein